MTPKDYAEQLAHIEERGIVVMRNITRFGALGQETIWPYATFVLFHSGTTRAMYDMQELIHGPNDIACVLPGHMHCPLECSEDSNVTVFILSQGLHKALSFHSFTHDAVKYHFAPLCHLTPEQAQHMMALSDQVEIIANHTEAELPHRKEMLLAILSVGHEFLNLYRREQDKEWEQQRDAQLLSRFSELVVEHFRESREVKFYAKLLNLSPKYFSKTITDAAGMSPSEWIEQYVVAQAKLMLLTQPMTVKETAYRLGFDESASFCRFFKRVAGVTPREFLKLK